MKQYILVAIIVALFTQRVHAASPTPIATSSATPSKTEQPKKLNQIDDLKERLATRVAELRQSQKKAFFGVVKAISVSTLTIETKTSDVKIELTDSIKVFQMLKGSRTTLTTDAIEASDTVVVFGDYDTSLDLMKAKVIVIQNPLPERISGTVVAIDKNEYTVTVETKEKQVYTVDIEKNTIISSYTKATGVSKSGFSKMITGAIVHVTGTLSTKIDHRISASRILDLGIMHGATPTPTPETELTKTASASGTPSSTKKTTPTATPKQ